MIIVMKATATEAQIEHVVNTIKDLGLKAHLSRGEGQTILGAIGDESQLRVKPLKSFPGVESVTPIQKPYKLAARQMSMSGPTASRMAPIWASAWRMSSVVAV